MVHAELEGIDYDSTIRVEVLEDPVGEALGVEVRSPYVERFWLPFLGPSTTWLLRYVAVALGEPARSVDLAVGEVARSLGLGGQRGRNGAFLRCVARAIDYEMAAVRGPRRLAFRRRLPPLPPRLVARLPEALAAEHSYVREGRVALAPDALAERGRQLALSLLELGESAEEAERQLLRWRFDPVLARRCSRWALTQTRGAGDLESAPGGDPTALLGAGSRS